LSLARRSPPPLLITCCEAHDTEPPAAGRRSPSFERGIASINYFVGFLSGQSALELHQYRLVNQSLKGTQAKGTGPGTPGYPTMQRVRDRELIFPIKDSASAALMLIKADCLHTAGIIDEAERQLVHCRARMFLDDATAKNAALPQSRAAYSAAI
jgi:hypothetical protein